MMSFLCSGTLPLKSFDELEVFDDPAHNSGENFAFPVKKLTKFTRRKSFDLKHIEDANAAKETKKKCVRQDSEIQSVSNPSAKAS